MAFPISVEGKLVTVSSGGRAVTHGEVVETLSLLGDRAEDLVGASLVIVDPGSEYEPSDAQLQQFVSMIARLLDGVFRRVALVASRDLHFGLGRMTEVYAGVQGVEFRVFRSEGDAVVWATATADPGEVLTALSSRRPRRELE